SVLISISARRPRSSSPAAPPRLHPVPTRRPSDLGQPRPPRRLADGRGRKPRFRGQPRGAAGAQGRRADLGLGQRQPDQRQFRPRSEEHTSELQSRENLVCRLLLEKKNTEAKNTNT